MSGLKTRKHSFLQTSADKNVLSRNIVKVDLYFNLWKWHGKMESTLIYNATSRLIRRKATEQREPLNSSWVEIMSRQKRKGRGTRIASEKTIWSRAKRNSGERRATRCNKLRMQRSASHTLLSSHDYRVKAHNKQLTKVLGDLTGRLTWSEIALDRFSKRP